jgi:hypothetical protein
MNIKFAEFINNELENVRYIHKNIGRLVRLAEYFEGVDLADVSSIYADTYSATDEITLYLKEDRKDSKLAHILAQHLGINFTKEKNYDKASLRYIGQKDQDQNGDGKPALRVVIVGAVPSTCTVEYTEEDIPEDQIVRTRTIARIKCDD